MASRLAPVAPGLQGEWQDNVRRTLDALWETFRSTTPRGPQAWALAERIEALQDTLWLLNDHGTRYHPFALLIDEAPRPLAESDASAACPR